ncbi:MAG: glycoside hydrolase family 3 C-terminal domain-containing protein [Acidobacteriaceae bacterium]|nr:glycoside hydrolase family 3 C-terminal domain-containing protein [Acidobacteriaceae bacterium]
MQNHSVAIPRLNIPEYDWWNEGLHGIARSGYATVFPQAIGMAATWDATLLHKVATAISTEARAKYNQAVRDNIHSIYYGLTIWSPNINIFRDPRWGRGQETYGEDPFLTSRLGVSFVSGLQGDDPKYLRSVATPKHFAVHSGPESERHRFNVEPSRFDLEDTYLPAFRATITEAHAHSVMCAYNAVDGVPACANQELLGTTLRKDWQFGGYVTSDCGAISDFFSLRGHKYSPDREHAAAAALQAGTDTSCGNEYAALVDAVKNKLISEEAVNTAVRRLFTARFRLGLFDLAEEVAYTRIPFSENDSAAHRALSLEIARKSIVLLKNATNTLPLTSRVKTIAVIGPNAASLTALEGNYNAVPSQPVLPLDGIEQEFAGRAKLLYAQGSPYANGVSLPVPRTVLHTLGKEREQGLTGAYFANSDFRGKPALRRTDREIDFDWNSASPGAGLPANDFSVRWNGTIATPKVGDYRFDIRFAHCFPCSSRESYAVFLDGKQIAEHATDESKTSHPSTNQPFRFHFADTNEHEIRIDYSHHSNLFGAGITLDWQPPQGALLPDALAAVKNSDLVIAFVGLSPELEGEEMPVQVDGFAGGDRTKIDLPDAQQELLRMAGLTGKPLVVVLLNGSAIAANWAQQHAAAILEAWYPGEAGGEAIAQTLAGRNNPGGRLPVTFYASLDQLPPFADYSMQGRTYRFFKGEPLYRFGDGLSYTNFRYSGLHLSSEGLKAGNKLTVGAEVTNSGKMAGDEVVEVFLTMAGGKGGAICSLRGFERLSLIAGESRHVQFELSPRDLSEVAADGSRSVQEGEYKIALGGRQPVQGFGGVTGHFKVIGTKELPR